MSEFGVPFVTLVSRSEVGSLLCKGQAPFACRCLRVLKLEDGTVLMKQERLAIRTWRENRGIEAFSFHPLMQQVAM